MLMMSQCLKITEKVSFNIEKPKACVQKVLPDISLLIGQKLVENAQIQKLICDILSNFQTLWSQDWYQKFCFLWCCCKNKDNMAHRILSERLASRAEEFDEYFRFYSVDTRNIDCLLYLKITWLIIRFPKALQISKDISTSIYVNVYFSYQVLYFVFVVFELTIW